MTEPRPLPKPFSESDIHRLARRKAIQHYTRNSKPTDRPQQVSIDVHVHLHINWPRVILVVVGSLAALALLLVIVNAVQASTAPASTAQASSPPPTQYPPMCVATRTGWHVEFPQTRASYWERVRRGQQRATWNARGRRWECKWTRSVPQGAKR